MKLKFSVLAIVVVVLAGALAIYYATRVPVPQPPDPVKPASILPESPLAEARLEDFFPPQESRDRLDPFTRATVKLFEEILPDLKKDPWPSRVKVLSDEADGDSRRLRLRLEKTFVVRGRKAGDEFTVTLASEEEKGLRHAQLGRKEGNKVMPIGTVEELRSAFVDLPAFRKVVFLAGDSPILLCETINFGLEMDDMRSLTAASVSSNESGGGVRVTIESMAFQVILTRSADRWFVSRIEVAK